MKAIILADAYVKELQPFTGKMPAAMIPYKGVPILFRLLDTVVSASPEEIIIVIGHMAAYLESRVGGIYNGVPVSYVENFKYNSTGSLYSLSLALPKVQGDILVASGCFICNQLLLSTALRYDSGCSYITSFLSDSKEGYIISDSQGPKHLAPIARFSSEFVKRDMIPDVAAGIESEGQSASLYSLLEKYISEGKKDASPVNVPTSWWLSIISPDSINNSFDKE